MKGKFLGARNRKQEAGFLSALELFDPFKP
jgi:hypothetical protein